MKSVLCFIVLLVLASSTFAQIPAVNDSAAANAAAIPVVNVTPVAPVTPTSAPKIMTLTDSVNVAVDAMSTRDLAAFAQDVRLGDKDRDKIIMRLAKDLNGAASVDSFTTVYGIIWETAPAAVSVQTLKRALPRRSTAQLRVLADRMTDPENLRPVERLIYSREMSIRDARIETLTQVLTTLISPLDSTLTSAEVLKNPRDSRTKLLGAAAHRVAHAENLANLAMATSGAVQELNGELNNLTGVVQEGFATERARTNELTLATEELTTLLEGHFADRRGILRRHHDGDSLAKAQNLRERLIASAR